MRKNIIQMAKGKRQKGKIFKIKVFFDYGKVGVIKIPSARINPF